MNVRLYDHPVLHRFLSPDNYVQDPFNSQNFNRYAYVLNNPLKYKDANGDFLVAALIRAVIGVIVNGINNSINNQGFFEGAVGAAIFGAIGGAASFGIGQIASNIASSFGSGVFQATAHFYTGGFLSVAHGGDLLSGGLAGGISSGIGSFTGGLLKNAGKFWQGVGVVGSGSISGGIGSRLAGGKFWDGFRQGAISSGLNHFAHKLQEVDPVKLKERILEDGKLTLKEANKWYRHGNGKPLTVDASKIDLDFIDPRNYVEGAKKFTNVQTLFKSQDGKIYGNIGIRRVTGNKFEIAPDNYGFEMHSKGFIRNIATKIGSWVAGKGTSYDINFRGYNTVRLHFFQGGYPKLTPY